MVNQSALHYNNQQQAVTGMILQHFLEVKGLCSRLALLCASEPDPAWIIPLWCLLSCHRNSHTHTHLKWVYNWFCATSERTARRSHSASHVQRLVRNAAYSTDDSRVLEFAELFAGYDVCFHHQGAFLIHSNKPSLSSRRSTAAPKCWAAVIVASAEMLSTCWVLIFFTCILETVSLPMHPGECSGTPLMLLFGHHLNLATIQDDAGEMNSHIFAMGRIAVVVVWRLRH